MRGTQVDGRAELSPTTTTHRQNRAGTPVMGNKNSIPVEAVEGFTIEEVNRLHKRFKKLDKDSNDTLCVEEFLALPELKENPLVQRVVQVFDADSDGELNFSEFVSGLAMFTTKNVDKQKKLKFLFNIYDLDRDGLISNSELFQVGLHGFITVICKYCCRS